MNDHIFFGINYLEYTYTRSQAERGSHHYVHEHVAGDVDEVPHGGREEDLRQVEGAVEGGQIQADTAPSTTAADVLNVIVKHLKI